MAPLLSSDLFQRVNSISQLGNISNTLNNSVQLKVFEGISIGSALPSLVEIFLDKISNQSSPDIADHYHFFPMVMMMVATGIMYLSCYEQNFMAYFYICNFGMKVLTLISVITHSLSTGVIATQQKMNKLLFIFPIIGIAAINISISYSILIPDSVIWKVVQTVSLVITLISTAVFMLYWFNNLWRHYQHTRYLGCDEKKELLYMVGGMILIISFTSVVPKFTSDWYDIAEKTLLNNCILFICALLFLTVIPNRILKTINEIKDNALRLKRAFVRYVSHEIRSPLSVATAGLELLRSELVAGGVSRAILELLDDISFANNTAVEILNDMLHYEHIDSGTFKLDCAVIPLLNVFAGRLEVYRFMTTKKHISLAIQDHIQVSDYFTADAVDTDSGNHPVRGLAENELPLTPLLVMDKFRVEQILRNLISNAIKFTPEGGNIVMRFLRVSASSTLENLPHMGQHSREAFQPVLELEDASVMKQVEEYLRIEVADSGAGMQCKTYTSMLVHDLDL